MIFVAQNNLLPLTIFHSHDRAKFDMSKLKSSFYQINVKHTWCPGVNRPFFGTFMKKVKVRHGKVKNLIIGDQKSMINVTQFEATIWSKHNKEWQ